MRPGPEERRTLLEAHDAAVTAILLLVVGALLTGKWPPGGVSSS